MSLLLYMDVNVERAITIGLLARELDVLTAQQDGHESRMDSELLDRATKLGRVIFTRDRDFLAEAHKRQSLNIYFSGIIYCHKLSLGIGACINDLELITKVLTAEEMSNRVQYLPVH